MKNKITQLLRFGLTMFAIGFLFTNCENEETQEEIISVENEIPSLTIKNYSKEKIEENTKLISRLKEINNNLIENKSAKESGKIIYNNEYDFTIDTDSAKYIENETYHSYTFPTVQGVDEKITNILFELNEHNEYDAFLVKYDYTSDELKQENLESLSMKTSMEPIDFDFESLSNKMKSNWVCVYSYEKIKHEGVISGHNGGNVGGTRITYEWVLLASHCEIVTNYIGSNETYGSNTATIRIGGSMTASGGGGSLTSPTPPSTPFEGEDLIKLNLVKDKLKLNLKERTWIDKNGFEALYIHEFLASEMFSDESIVAADIYFKTAENNLLSSGFSDQFMSKVYCCSPNLITNSTLGLQYYNYVKTQIAIIKSEYPPNYNFSKWELAKISMEANLDALQLGLDVIGLIPGFGEVADIANGVIYTVRGDGVNATLSYASAVPIAGWFAAGTKWAKKTVDAVNIASDISSKQTLVWIAKANGLIDFGKRGQLAKVLGTTGTPKHAHHIIPWAFRDLAIVQKAAKSKSAFHMNEALNGIPLPSTNHLTGHNSIDGYNNTILEVLDNLNDVSTSNDHAAQLLEGLTNHIRNLIESNPDLNLGQIADLISYP